MPDNVSLACILTLDVGSSSVRTLLFSFEGVALEGYGIQIPYQPRTAEAAQAQGPRLQTGDEFARFWRPEGVRCAANSPETGGWEIDAPELTGIVAQALTQTCQQLRTKNLKPAAVAVDTFWHSLVGVTAQNRPATAILHPFDSRSTAAALQLAQRVNNQAQHARTGCMLHPSYPPSKLLWLSATQPDAFAAATRWMSAGEYLFLEFFGVPAASTSMVSAGGLWDQNGNHYDEELLAALPLRREQLADPATLDRPCAALLPAFAEKWPELNGIPWFPALGDGACDNIGSGCATRDRWALMVGTSGAMRVTLEAPGVEIPPGLFCYRVDPKRFVIGGALSNGGAVYAWMKRVLRLPDDAEIERQLSGLTPGMHGLTMLPLFAGERSTEWRMDVRGAIAGLSSSTTPLEILHAGLESVALRFRNVYEILEKTFGPPAELVGSGGALMHSPVWTQMMADTLGHSLRLCREPEATSRGAALLALERLGVIRNLSDLPPLPGDTIQPDPSKKELYQAALARQRRLYTHLFEEN